MLLSAALYRGQRNPLDAQYKRLNKLGKKPSQAEDGDNDDENNNIITIKIIFVDGDDKLCSN